MSTVAKLTLDEYDRMIQAGVFDRREKRRIELIRGELREMSPINPPHESAVDYLNEWSIRNLPTGMVWVRIQNSIGLTELMSVPEPDVVCVKRKDYSRTRPIACDVLLVVEISESSIRYDLGEKRELYAGAGLEDYWVVNIPKQCVEVFRQPDRSEYRQHMVCSGGDTIAPLTFPELTLTVSDLLPGE